MKYVVYILVVALVWKGILQLLYNVDFFDFKAWTPRAGLS